MKLISATTLVVGAAGHGAMTHPRPRNAYSEPANEPSPEGDLSCQGDSCFWYSIGCHIGCPTCTMTGKDLYPDAHCTAAEGLIEPTLPDEFRSWDPYGQSDCGDFTKYNPWRAPGKAANWDPCGAASGMRDQYGYATVPHGYRTMDKGSEVLPEREPTYWQAGGTAQVGWGLAAQHGGGYSYRLCPKNQPMTEACFQANPLSFTAANSTVNYDDNSKDTISIPTKTYTSPEGTMWRTSPIPGCNCDSGLTCNGGGGSGGGSYCPPGTYPGNSPYPRAGSPTTNCPRGTMFQAGFDDFTQGFLVGAANKISVMDEVNVPNTPGEYVLSWRWDCEATDQVWNSCADIVITNGVPPAPAPTPPAPHPSPPAPTPPSPAPTPSGKCGWTTLNKQCKGIGKKSCYYVGCQECGDEASSSCGRCCDGCKLVKAKGKAYCMDLKEEVTV